MVDGDHNRKHFAVPPTLRRIAIHTLVLCATLSFFAAPLRADQDSARLASAAKLIQAGKIDKAEAELWQVLQVHPENAEALNLLGSIRLQQKRFAESETLLRRATALNPQLLPAYLNLGRLYHAQTEADKEIAVLLESVRIAPENADVNCALAAAYLKKNDYHNSLEALQRIPAAHRPDNALPLLAASYLGLGSVSEARSIVPAIMSRSARNHDLPVEFADVLLSFDLVDDALSVLQVAQKQPPLSSDFFLTLGRTRERKGDLAAAQKDFQHALELNPKSTDSLQALAHLLANQGQWQQSLETLARARALAPDSPEILRKFAAVSLHAGRTADAADAAQQLVKLRPDEPEALYLMGVAQLQDGDAEEAQKTFEKYVNVRSADPLAFLALGMVKVSLHNLSAAQADFERCIQLDPKQVEAYYELGMISKDQGDESGAISQLEKAVALDPQHARAHALLGQMYLSQRDYSKAQDHLLHAAELAPRVADTHYQLGLLFARLNQRDRAQREMEEFHKLKEQASPGPAQPGAKPAPSSIPLPPS